MSSRLIGSTLLIVGTTIGAGMLALPVATAEIGFWGSILLLTVAWLVMVTSSFLFLEVNLRLPPNCNLISMAGSTLGKPGQAVVWVFYLLLLYSVLSSYISGGGDLVLDLLGTQGMYLPSSVASVLFTLGLGAVVFVGIHAVDYVNRGLMFGKMGAYFVLVVLIMPFVSSVNLNEGSLKFLASPYSINIAIVSFTSMMIIPSLRVYLHDNAGMLRKAIFFGTLIPLLCYIVWVMAILGVIPLQGNYGMEHMFHSSKPNSELVADLTYLLQSEAITIFARFFLSICMATTFLSIGICLNDFLSDGLSIKKKGASRLLLFVLTFAPPTLVALYYPNAFLNGLKYAGLSVFILMVFMPALMTWRLRYYQGAPRTSYQIRGGKPLLVILMVFSLCMIYLGFVGKF